MYFLCWKKRWFDAYWEETTWIFLQVSRLSFFQQRKYTILKKYPNCVCIFWQIGWICKLLYLWQHYPYKFRHCPPPFHDIAFFYRKLCFSYILNEYIPILYWGMDFNYHTAATYNASYFLGNQLFVKISWNIRIKNLLPKQFEKACMCFWKRCVRSRDFTVLRI